MASTALGDRIDINGQTAYHTGNLNPVGVGHVDHLWQGAHYMDGGAWLNTGHDFNGYQAIVCDCHVAADYVGRVMGVQQLWMPTWNYGWATYDFGDLMGDDWCAAYLADNYNIVPSAGSGVYIMNVYGVR